MGSEHGWLSLVPPVLTIVLALVTRRVLLSLFVGVIASHLLLAERLVQAPVNAIQQMIDTSIDRGNFVIIAFSLFVGGLLALIRAGGGFEAFAKAVESHRHGLKRSTTFGINWIIGAVMFLDAWSNILINGATTGSLYDRQRISRARLAYYIHTIGLCFVAVIIINSWGAFYMGLLRAQNVTEPFSFLVSALPYMVYPWISFAVVAVVMVTGLSIGPMRRFDAIARQEREEGVVERREAVDEAVLGAEAENAVSPRGIYLTLPLVTLFVVVFVALYTTGNGDILAGDGSLSILYAVLASSLVCGLLLRLIGKLRSTEIEKRFIDGSARFFDVGILIVLALSIGQLTRELGTGAYIASAAEGALPLFLVPALIFLLGSIMSFATGTSYGTLSIMLPIGLALATTTGIDPALMFGACLSGALFGDNTSPIADNSIMTSIATGVPIVDHVASQLPYALIAACLTLIGFVLLGTIA